MPNFLSKAYPFNFTRRRRLRYAIWGAIGFFLFILFFQPFGIEQTDFNNYILLIAGFGGIAFITYTLVHIPVPWNRLSLRLGSYNLNVLLFFELSIWVLNTVAFTFYLRYVAHINLSIFMVFRITLITLFQLIINMLTYELSDLKQKIDMADQTGGPERLSREEKDISLIFTPQAGTEKLKLKLDDLILLKSAENYVEFYFMDEGSMQKKLLRTTLTKVEDQLGQYDNFIRCHRNSIVNFNFVKKMHRTSDGFRLEIEEYHEKIAVSRQYLLQVKKAIE